MNYKLAKELKDAGFPLKEDNSYSSRMIDDKDYDLPTFTELIEACGDVDLKFQRYPDHRDERKWTALCDGFSAQAYSTPEEAVARLWLALNKKE